MTTRTRAVEPEALFEIAKVDDSVYGPVVCVAAALWVGWVFYNGSREVKAISEELEAKGYDVGSIQRLKELKETPALSRRITVTKGPFQGSP